MRFLTTAAAIGALLAFQATPGLSQTTTQEPPAAPAPAAPAPAAPAPAAPETTAPQTTAPATTPAPAPHKATKRHAKRMTLHQRFEAANTAKNGHLTPDEAKAAKWTYVERHFDAMDRGHKGYVTEADIHAYARAQYLARHPAKSAPPAAPAPAPAESAPAAPAPAQPAPAQE